MEACLVTEYGWLDFMVFIDKNHMYYENIPFSYFLLFNKKY